ncbi:retrovirus-related pol polyprotein from transposon TNT 1-94 [Tanacetum coccineum]
MAAVNDVPQLVDKKGGSYAAIAPKLEPRNLISGKNERRVVVQDQRLKSIIMSCLPDDIMESVISRVSAKETWTDFVYSFEGPSDSKENKIIDMKLEYQAFRAKPTESLSQTYTRYKTLLNKLDNDGVNLIKHEINIGFVNSLSEKWLTFSQGLRNANHTKTLDLADIYGRFVYEDNLIQRRYSDTKKAIDFQENSDDKVDERSSEEYLRDLDIEYQERSILANSKYYKAECKKMKAKLALLEASPSRSQNPKTFQPKNKGLVAKTFDWDEEEVSNEEEVTQVKILMTLADDELTVEKSHARNGEWVNITIRKVNNLLSMDEDADWQNYLKYINIDLKFVEEQRLNLLFKYNKMVFELNKCKQIKEEKKINETWLTSSKKISQCINEQIPHQKKKVLGGELFTESSSKMNENENIFVPDSMGYDQKMALKTKDLVERLNPDSKLLNFNTRRILFPKSQAVNESLESTKTSNTPESSKDSKAEFLTPLPPLKNLQGASPSSKMLIDEKVNSNQKTQESYSKTQKTESSKSVNLSRMTQDSKPKVQNTGSSKSLRPKPIQKPQFKIETHQGAHLVYGQWILKEYDWCQELSAQIYRVTRFTNTSVDDIGIDDSSRSPPDEFLQEDDPSRQYQVDSDISYYIIPHGCSLTKLTQENHVPEVIAPNEPDIPYTEDTEVPHVTQFHISNQAFTSSHIVPQDRWSRDQNIELVNIIGDPGKGMLTRSMAAKLIAASASECLFADFLSDAMQEELNQFYRNKLWTLEEGIDYDETFAPVPRMKSIRIFLAFATYTNFKVYQMDVKSAFLNGKVKEEFYVKQPPGFESSEFLDYVCKLDKALYGLKQAPKAWKLNQEKLLMEHGHQEVIKVLELQDGVVDSPGQDGRLSNGHNLEDKEITALCWASSNGTVLAVGYLDGDIMFWKTSTTASGGEIGSEEVLTVLTLEWSARIKTLRCVGRADLTLSGSFFDMRLLLSTRNNHVADLLVAVLDMDVFLISFMYNGDHVKSPKGARPKDLDKPIVRVLGMAELKVSLTKAYNKDNRRKKQMVHLRIILDLQVKVPGCIFTLTAIANGSGSSYKDSVSPLPLAVNPKKRKSQTVTPTLPKLYGPKVLGVLSKKSKMPKSKKPPIKTKVAVLDMDVFLISFMYNGDHVKSPKGARPKDLDKPVNKLMFDTTAISMHVIGMAIANGLVIRVLGMEELKVSLTKANNEDNRRKKQMVHLRIILDLQSKSSASEASTAAAAPKCCLSNVLVLKEVSHYCLGTRMICAASVYFVLLMQDLMLPVVISYVNAAIDTTAIGFKRSPGCIYTLTTCTLGLGPGCIFTLTAIAKWECSSYGRAIALHARGTGFDSPHFLIFSLCD